MKNYDGFYSSIKNAADTFSRWDKSRPIQVISHLDADGITACAILTRLLNNENRKYTLSILPQLNREKIEEFREDQGYLIFADFGSGQINDIRQILGGKEAIILDHHEPDHEKSIEGVLPEPARESIVHINPHLFGIDGSKEISGAGVVYLFAKDVDPENEELAHLAIIGAVGDVQEEEGFMRLNNEILETAVQKGKIKVKQSLRLFGAQTRPIHKALEYTSDPFIPGVSGSESGAIQFLHQIGIDPKTGNKWKRLIDLEEGEMQSLVAGIIMRRLGEGDPENVIGKSYILPEEKPGSPTRDAREFATLLNACGRMEKACFGIGTCLGIESDRRNALQTASLYKKKIVESINWYHDSAEGVLKEDGYIIIDAKENVPATMIGTLASILSKSNDIKEGTYILSLARSDAGMTKVSLRISGLREQDVDLREVVKDIVAESGGEAGGHKFAAGALIETEKEEMFLKTAKKVLSSRQNKKV